MGVCCLVEVQMCCFIVDSSQCRSPWLVLAARWHEITLTLPLWKGLIFIVWLLAFNLMSPICWNLFSLSHFWGKIGFTLFYFRRFIGKLLCSNGFQHFLTAVEWQINNTINNSWEKKRSWMVKQEWTVLITKEFHKWTIPSNNKSITTSCCSSGNNRRKVQYPFREIIGLMEVHPFCELLLSGGAKAASENWEKKCKHNNTIQKNWLLL